MRRSNCRETYQTLSERGVEFLDPPTDAGYGVQAVFQDLYGNGFVLLERHFNRQELAPTIRYVQV